MKTLLLALCALSFITCAHAETSAADGSSCEAKAVDKNGKPLAGAAKSSFIKKCEKDMGAPDAKAACEAKAMDKNGKPLHGAAKTSSMKKCMAGG